MTPLQNTQQESRRFQRFSVLSDVKVYFQFDGQHRPLNARLIDISYPFMGLKVVGNYGISEQSAITLELMSDKERLIIRCRGVVAWCHESMRGETPDESVYQIGIFVGANSKEAQQALDTQILPLIPVRLRDLYTRLKNQSTSDYVQRHFKGQDIEYTDPIETAIAPILNLNHRCVLLMEMITKINSTLNPDKLLFRIMEAAREIMNSQASSLILLDRTTGDLLIQIPTGPIKEQITGIRIPRRKGFAGWVAEHGEPVVCEDAATDPRHYRKIDYETGFETKSLICIPMRGPSGEIIGVLQALNHRGNTPYTQTDIDLFTVLADQAAIAIEGARLHAEELEKQRLEQQLILAHHIQESLLPNHPPVIEGASLWGMSQSALHVGGDYYDFISRKDGSVGLVVGDISGKGAPAALLMASLQSLLRTHTQYHNSIAETVSHINDDLREQMPKYRFLTLFYAIFDPMTKALAYTNAGHNPPLLYRSNTRKIKRLKVGGPIVGIWPESSFNEGHETLQTRDILVIYTDGVTEAIDSQEEMFGEERLYELILHNSHLNVDDLVQLIYQTICDFTQGVEQVDDITLLILKVE